MAVVTNVTCAKDAQKAAEFIARMFGISAEDPVKPIGFMPGSGWGLAVELEDEVCMFMHKVPGLEILEEYPVVPGHERSIRYGGICRQKGDHRQQDPPVRR